MIGKLGAVTLAIAAALPAPAQAAAGDAPDISDQAYCAAIYGALARAQTRAVPDNLRNAAGFTTIDFAARRKALDAKLAPVEAFAITYWQQSFEISFDLAAEQEAAGKAADTAIQTEAITRARNCDKDNGFTPALLDRLAASPTLPAEPYWCAVNYFTLGMGMGQNPQAQQQVRAKIQALMGRSAPPYFAGKPEDLREAMQADAAERNRAVATGALKPDQLFTTAAACDRILSGV